MNNLEKNFFLIIRGNYFSFNIISKDYEVLYEKETFYDKLNLKNDFNRIKKFLDENIFQIEKKFNLYIENIYLIIEDENFVKTDVSLTKEFNYLSSDFNNILGDLSMIKESVLKSNDDFQLIHMIINKFIVDKKDYSELPDQLDKKNFFLEIKLICLEKKRLINLKKILSEYQISIHKILNYEYVDTFKKSDLDNISVLATKLLWGLNKNEINLKEKHSKNIGFFEKFFKFFS